MAVLAIAGIAADPSAAGVVHARFTVSDEGKLGNTEVVFEADRGEANHVLAFRDETEPDYPYAVRDLGAPIRVAGKGCVQRTPFQVNCLDYSGVEGGSADATLLTGDGDDVVEHGDLKFTYVYGGGGDDRLQGWAVHGGAGRDVIDTRGGALMNGGGGDDLLRGETATYAGRPRPVHVDLAARSGGGPGERDTLIDVANVLGGRGDDELRGDAGENQLIGGHGDDVLLGARGADRLYGGHGSDTLRGGGGADFLVGGADGDRLFARDGERDRRVDCGAGLDWARVDALDPAFGCDRSYPPAS